VQTFVIVEICLAAHTIVMSHSHSSLFEVTQALLNCANATGFRFGDDTALVAVQHMLKQTVDLFQTVVTMGLDVKNIFALGKVYSNNVEIIETLREMGVTVVESDKPPPGEFQYCFEQDTERLWRVATEQISRRRIKRVLVLDDGGVCITSTPPEILQRFAVCGVEQTSLGMFLFEVKPPPFAVMSWARAAVKLEIGGPIFSQWFIDRLNREFLRGRTLQGERLGVIGVGSIGRGVANLAAKQGNEVLYCDPNTDLRHTLSERVTRVDSVEDLLLRCDYILGCSGRNPFKDNWPLRHKPGIRLFSASSGDQEFGPIIKDLKQKPAFKVAPDTWDIVSNHGPSGPIHVAYMGYPYSFVSRGVEAVPTEIVQFDTGGLLAALVQARLFLEECETGREQNRGIHRLSPQAQRFVYERWIRAVKDRMIDTTELFRHDPGTLSSTQHDDWFVGKTEPHPSKHYQPVKAVEETMNRFIGPGYRIKAQGQH
jgi:D-isomer specific 2-hydroxyacid dehydrogenase, NAD binding domain